MQQLRLFPMPLDTAQSIHYYPLFWLQAFHNAARSSTLVVRSSPTLYPAFRRRVRSLRHVLASHQGFLVTLCSPAGIHGSA